MVARPPSTLAQRIPGPGHAVSGDVRALKTSFGDAGYAAARTWRELACNRSRGRGRPDHEQPADGGAGLSGGARIPTPQPTVETRSCRATNGRADRVDEDPTGSRLPRRPSDLVRQCRRELRRCIRGPGGARPLREVAASEDPESRGAPEDRGLMSVPNPRASVRVELEAETCAQHSRDCYQDSQTGRRFTVFDPIEVGPINPCRCCDRAQRSAAILSHRSELAAQPSTHVSMTPSCLAKDSLSRCRPRITPLPRV